MNTSLLRIAGLGLSVLWAATSCRNTEPTYSSEAIIEVTSLIDEAQQAVASRASTEVFASKALFVSTDQIGIWAVPYLNSVETTLLEAPWEPINNYADNVPFISNGTVFAPTTGKEIYYPSPRTLVDLYGVYPYNATMSDPANNSMPDPKAFEFSIAQDQRSAGQVVASDLMSAKAEKAQQGTAITMSFTHRLSRVLVRFNVPALYQGNSVIEVAKVEVCNIPLKAVVDLSDATKAAAAIGTDNTPVDILAHQAGKPDNSSVDGDYTYEAIVVPGTIVASGTNIVRVTLNVASLGAVAFDCKVSADYTYLATQLTTVGVTLAEETAITLPAGNVKITKWGDNTPPEIETVKPANMILDVAVNANMNKAANVKFATITIDKITYTKVPASYDLATQTITITYPQSSKIWGYDLVSLSLLDATGVAISGITYTPAPSAVAPITIPGNPTEVGYSKKIGISAAF